MLSSSCNALLKLSKTTYPQKLFDYDCITLYIVINVYFRSFLYKGNFFMKRSSSTLVEAGGNILLNTVSKYR